MGVVNAEQLKAYYITQIFGTQRTLRAVDDVSLDIRENEILGIAGESGCGKTTLMKALLGMVKPPLTITGGGVSYNFGDGIMDAASLRPEDITNVRWKKISYIPQGSMSVLNPVRKLKKIFQDFIKAHYNFSNNREFNTLVNTHLSALGLPLAVLKAYPHQLSGGMRQRVTIALATILNPRVIFADEPTTALDVVVQRGVIQLLKDIQTEHQNTIVIVTHDMAVHANLTNRVAIMYAGQIVEEGNTRDIFKQPLHCYSQYLIGSLPRIGDKSYRVSAPGSPPLLTDPPEGCRFQERCPEAFSRCCEESPPLVDFGNGHKVACFKAFKEMGYDA